MFDASNSLFHLAVQFVNQTASSLFITGKAGTGKTTFLKYVRDHTDKKLAIVAPTGVAAINAGGVTMHSFFQLPFGSFIPGTLNHWNEGNMAISDRHTLLKNLRLNLEKRTVLQELELLIIDEVSMVRADMLDAADHILRHVRKQPNTPFGGVQVIYIGDLFQLPPVVNRDEWELLKTYYQSPFFFDSQVTKAQPPLYLELKHIYRQNDSVFIDVLNNIRDNKVNAADLELLHRNYKPGFQPPKEENYIVLTTHNFKAEAINRRAIDALQGKTYSFSATLEGDFNEKSLPAEMNLQLKIGAQVMFIKNDKGEARRYFNGKIGTIARIKENAIFVKFTEKEPEVELATETWKNVRYYFDKAKNRIEEEEVGSFTQFPIRLAWAITIHKSQGLTFEKAIIDAGESFAPGQVYVALSRLISLQGLVLYSRILPESISTDERILSYTQNEKGEDILQQLLVNEQKEYVYKKVFQLFSWSKLLIFMEDFMSDYPSRVIPDKAPAHIWADNVFDSFKQQDEIALKFLRQLQQIKQSSDFTDQLFRERVAKAADYFIEALNNCLEQIEFHIGVFKLKQKTRKYIADLYDLTDQVMRKKTDLRRSLRLLGIEEDPDIVSTSPELSQEKEKTRSKKPARVSETKLTSLELFQDGKSIAEIAGLRSMAESTIYGHLLFFFETGEVTLAQLVSPEKQQQIEECMNEFPDAAVALLREKLSKQISYGEIKAVWTDRKMRFAGSGAQT